MYNFSTIRKEKKTNKNQRNEAWENLDQFQIMPEKEKESGKRGTNRNAEQDGRNK